MPSPPQTPNFYNKLAQLCQHYTIGRLAVVDDTTSTGGELLLTLDKVPANWPLHYELQYALEDLFNKKVSFAMPLHEKYWKEYVVLYDKNTPPNTNPHHSPPPTHHCPLTTSSHAPRHRHRQHQRHPGPVRR